MLLKMLKYFSQRHSLTWSRNGLIWNWSHRTLNGYLKYLFTWNLHLITLLLLHIKKFCMRWGRTFIRVGINIVKLSFRSCTLILFWLDLNVMSIFNEHNSTNFWRLKMNFFYVGQQMVYKKVDSFFIKRRFEYFQTFN